MNRHYLHIPVKRMTKVGVLHENARISRRFWRKLISLMSIWANYSTPFSVYCLLLVVICKFISSTFFEKCSSQWNCVNYNVSMTRFKLPSKIVLLTVPRRYFSLWIICLFMSCVSHAFASVNCCIVVTCCEKLNSWLSFVMFGCVFVIF